MPFQDHEEMVLDIPVADDDKAQLPEMFCAPKVDVDYACAVYAYHSATTVRL